MNEQSPSPSNELALTKASGRPSGRSPRRHVLPLALVLAAGVGISLGLFLIVRQAEQRRIEADFQGIATAPAAVLQAEVEDHLEMLRSIQAFYFSSHTVDRDEFHAFTRDALRVLKSVHALAWVPRVAATDRVAHELTVRMLGYGSYEIAEYDTGGRRRAGDKGEYYPVLYVEPEQENRGMIGWDLSGDQALISAMTAARDGGASSTTPLMTVQLGDRQERLYRFIVPIYQNRVTHESAVERQQNLGGYAIAFVRAEAMVQQGLSKLPEPQIRGLALQVRDMGGGRAVIHTSQDWRTSAADESVVARHAVKLPGGALQVVARPAAAFYTTQSQWQSWGVLAASLMLTLAVAGYLSSMWDRAAEIEKQVVDRTAELGRTNRSLKEEITARKEMADALAHERYLVDALMDTIPDHIYFKDLKSRFLRVNKAMAGAFKLSSPNEAIGKTDFDFFTAEHAQRAFDDEQQILATEEPIIGREEKETWPDGSVTWVSTSKDLLRDPAGNIIGTFGISRDITARKKAEQALAEKAQELQRSNTELEQFAYVASHDLQEPLRMVASYTQLLARRYKGKLDAEADEFISYSVEGATRMQGLINDLLMYSRVGTRGKPFAWVDCNEVLARTVANLKLSLDETQTVLTHDLLPHVMGDPIQLIQLFQNLISNGLKFSGFDKRPEIHISAEARVADDPDRGGYEWLFSVRDNGIGIEQKYFDRIFIIFQRLHTREQYPGTGIGLALCKKIVERHGGQIWVESQPGKGSTFYFSLPKLEPPHES